MAAPPDSLLPPWDQELLNAMPEASAVLDVHGVVQAVNYAWRMFTLDNGGEASHTGVGVDYFAVCRRSADAGCTDAAEVLAALQSVLKSESVERELEYPCPSRAADRWFSLRITKINWDPPALLVSHSNVSVRKAVERDLERTASQDPLTSLANRTRFTQRLVRALTPRPNRPVSANVGLLYLDLDGFKAINDTYGHAVGDEVLQTVASRLSKVCRPQDTIARLGGDEFAIVAPRIRAAALAGFAGRIEGALATPHPIHGTNVVVNVSVGTYLATPGEDDQAALHRADEAMYENKRSARAPTTA